MAYAELSITSNFTFLTGGSHPQEYARRATELGLNAIAIADVNSVAGIVRAYSELKTIAEEVEEARAYACGERQGASTLAHDWPVDTVVPRLLPACRIVTVEGLEATVLPMDRAGWGRLCRMITLGRRRVQKGDCHLELADLLTWGAGLAILLHMPHVENSAHCQTVAKAFPGTTWLAAAPRYDGQDTGRLARGAKLARTLGIPMVATAEPMMHHGSRRRVTDVLACIREGRVIEDLGLVAQPNAERRLRAEAEMERIFRDHPDALAQTMQVADAYKFRIDQLRYEYPSEISEGEEPQDRLTRLAREGLDWRYPDGVPARVTAMAEEELRLIAKLGYAPYFLTVADVVRFARSRDILCQGRGSAANSVVCYALGVTSVSPEICSMVFARFVSEARNEPPDIDVDFEHERREEVIQHIYERYGRERAGICATVIHYRGKRAIREVGAAMGLSVDTVSALSSQLWGWGSSKDVQDERLREIGLDPADPRLKLTLDLVREVQGFPRHLSQHVGGFVMTHGRLDELVPIENATMEDRTVICWDKDDIDALGILKVDVLGLGMLSCIRKAFDLMRLHLSTDYALATLPSEDPAVYDMLCEADSLGVFQVESRAQMNFLPRMRPRTFYDLVIQVAIIRPGPIQGDMVHPFIRRRKGEEKVSFPSNELGEVLGKTLGVPLFQEQAMQIAIIGAGFDPAEADRLRRALATFKKQGSIDQFRERFMEGMLNNGYDRDFSERCFSQIEGFGSYGFPESHAASFALLVYASAWLKCHQPAVFACALLNSQPMGFYAPAQIVRDAREHGVVVRQVDVNSSFWDNTLEPDGRGGLALRLGFRQIRAMKEDDGLWMTAARGNGYASVEDVWRKAGIGPRILQVLAEADGFASLGLTRREALWQAKAIKAPDPLPLFADDLDGEGIREGAVALPKMSEGEEIVEDFLALRLTLRRHPMALLRPHLTPADGNPPVEAGKWLPPLAGGAPPSRAMVLPPVQDEAARPVGKPGRFVPRGTRLKAPSRRGGG